MTSSTIPPDGHDDFANAVAGALAQLLDALAEEEIEAQRARHAVAHGEKGITHG